MAVLGSNHKKQCSLEKDYKAMPSLLPLPPPPPSSIEAERSFSAAGLFVTKLRVGYMMILLMIYVFEEKKRNKTLTSTDVLFANDKSSF